MFSLRNLISVRRKSIRKAFAKTIGARRGAINQKRRHSEHNRNINRARFIRID